MSRSSTISTYQKGKTWYVRFPKGRQRVKASCKTHSENEAKEIARDIGFLFQDPNRLVHSRAYEIFHGKKPTLDTKDRKSAIIRQMSKYTNEDNDEYIIGDMSQRIEVLEEENTKLKEDTEYWKAKYEGVTSTLEGKMVAEQNNLPTLKEALELYKEDIKHLQRWKRNYYNFIYDFFENDIGLKTKINEVTSLDIRKCLIEDSKEESINPEERWNRKRQMFTKFFNWSTGLWSFLNPCTTVGTKKEEEREDPDFHDLEEILKVISIQDTPYNKALVETLFFTGMIAKELRGVLIEDYFKIDGAWHIRVSPNSCRNIKAGKRRRNIPVLDSLKLVLDDYIKNHHPGGEVLFPPNIKGCRGQYWNEGTFSRFIQNQCKFNQFQDMDCKSTRRTYGSIMLRLGYSYAEVASLMGNSIQMVEKHYARYKASEVNMKKYKKKFTDLIKKTEKKNDKK